MSPENAKPGPGDACQPAAAVSASSALPKRQPPSRWQSIWLFIKSDLSAITRSWLCRGFLLVSMLFTILEFKGMQGEQKAASQMLEAVYATYLIVWMHGVIFIAGSALMREADCLNEAILCRGVTRGEYITGKLIARCLAVCMMIGLVLLPTSFWAIRQDKLVRTRDGFVTSAARNIKVEAWEPKKIFAEVGGTVKELKLQAGEAVHVGDMLAALDDRIVFDELESERRGEENARNEVVNATRRVEDARRNVAQAEDALERAERGLVNKDLLSQAEQADRQTDIRARKRDLLNAESLLRAAEEAVQPAERAVANAQARVRESRRRLAKTSILSPIAGYVTEVLAHPSQYVGAGAQLLTLAPLDDYQINVPVYKYDEFKRLKTGLTAFVKIESSDYKGTVERLGAMTQPDRWGRECNYAVVRFKGDGELGLLGRSADVKLVLPPLQEKPNRVMAMLNMLTGQTAGDAAARSSSVPVGCMLIGLAKVIGSACLLVTLTMSGLVVFRNALTSILGVVGLWHISNLLFDFVGLKEVSYVEMVGTMARVVAGMAKTGEEIAVLGWLFGLSAAFGLLAAWMFISRDPVK